MRPLSLIARAVGATTLAALGAGMLAVPAHASVVPCATYSCDTVGDITTVRLQSAPSVVIATFTKGARTVTVDGATRTLTDPADPAVKVTHSTYVWVRTAFDGTFDSVEASWLDGRRTASVASAQDVLAVASQYYKGAPAVTKTDATYGVVQYRGDAHYGPKTADGTSRQEGSDFNDYLQVDWNYNDGQPADAHEPDHAVSLDCSGFVRMLYGYRFGVPLGRPTATDADIPPAGKLPRRAWQQYQYGLGKVIIADAGTQAAVTSALKPGDLVFFDADSGDGTQLDHWVSTSARTTAPASTGSSLRARARTARPSGTSTRTARSAPGPIWTAQPPAVRRTCTPPRPGRPGASEPAGAQPRSAPVAWAAT